jgi:hydroxymethylpyrimidine kinase/phosphomethylpyrimidine kinase/thiamine-phosphate diphosphorylase
VSASVGTPPTGVLLVTDRRQADRPLVDIVRDAAGAGVRWVLLRERDLPPQRRRALAEELRAVLEPLGGLLVVAGPDPLGGYAVHLSAADPYPPPALPLVGRSCHDPVELGRLSTEDYVTLSPVFPTASKPGYGPALTPDGLSRLVRRTGVPVLALGGVGTAEQAAACVRAGAAGVAVMGALMRCPDPAALARELVAACRPATAGADSAEGVVSGGPVVALTIAGSDSGGGAGIQADLKVFAALGLFGTSVLTAVTAQNTREVRTVHPVPARQVAAQIDAVLDDLPVRAVKTGMLGSARVAAAVAARARAGLLPDLVVDPVLVSTSGHRLGVVAAVERLLPYAVVATPNREEAGAMVGRRVSSPDEMAAAARDIAAGGPRYVLVTGGDAGADDAGAEAVDALWTGTGVTLLRGPWIATGNTHGTGCSLSAAIAARLALGEPVPAAVRFAKEYVHRALSGARGWRLGAGHGPLDHFGWSAPSLQSD